MSLSLASAGIVLGVPAMVALGVSSSPHCALMCAPLTQLGGARRHAPVQLHAGRLLSYAGLGALAGGLGGALMIPLQQHGHADVLRFAAGLALLMVAGLQWRAARPLPACCNVPRPTRRADCPPWIRGLLWGLLPCPLLWSVLTLATLSGGAVDGALLTSAFGVGTTPLLMAMTGIGQHWLQRWPEIARRRVGAAVLTLSGLWIMAALPAPMAPAMAWCGLR